MDRWLPRPDLLLARIPSPSQRAAIPYVRMTLLALALTGGLGLLVGIAAIPPASDVTDGVIGALGRTWHPLMAVFAAALAWVAAVVVIAPVVGGETRRMQPLVLLGALVPPLLLAWHGVQSIGSRRLRRAYAWPLRFLGATLPWTLVAVIGAALGAAPAGALIGAGMSLAAALLLYTGRSLAPVGSWPERRLRVGFFAIQAAALAMTIAAYVPLLAPLHLAGDVATLVAVGALGTTLLGLTAERPRVVATMAPRPRTVVAALPHVGG